MEQVKGSLGSQMQTPQQQQQQQQQNQSKKKSKNKKKSSKNESNTVTRSNEEHELQQQQPIEGVVALENGLTDQLKQQLHISNDSNSSSCSSSNSNNKVNGLMTENLKKSKACPPTTTTSKTNIATNDNQQKQPALNGHHLDKDKLSAVNGQDDGTCQQQAVNKKSKRKPNNKKNNSSLEDNENQLENGHCPETVTNGFSHQEPQILANETKLNTAMNATNNNSTSTPSNNNIKTKADNCSKQPTKEQETQEESSSLELVTLSKSPELDLTNVHIEYKEYESELQMHDIMRLIQAELSEPYSIYTYRYFIYNWPKLCFLAAHGNEYVGAIVCKLDMYMNVRRGYIAMLAVRKEYRKLKIGTTLVQKAIEAMLADKADEVVLETEMSNLPALRLYENLGFVRDKRLFRYYLNGVDALRLKLWFR
ncbi:N-alpha-acetyltransferase 30A [Calliphora vicina]|uniref:N-alpha-acetyltransferase 30A n=1 Tax=Calliphora vicina TaxID=7373 RepID=UPI00325C3316